MKTFYDSFCKYFKEEEFHCPCGQCDYIDIDLQLKSLLLNVREHFEKPVIITSGYRCKEHNKAIGGARFSKHIDAIACDIVVKDTSHKEVYDYLFKLLDCSFGGLGLYRTHVHIDVREHFATWNNTHVF